MRLSFTAVFWFCLAVVIGVPVALVLWLGGGGRPGAPAETGDTVALWVDGQGIESLPLEEYVIGAVAAEVPALFEKEALKAQAVTARTYVVRLMTRYGGSGSSAHPGADISTDPREGQAWASQAELRKKWGFWGYLRLWRRIAEAVEATRGEILTYGGRPILALYSSTSGDHTEDSEEVFGTYLPYLRSVPCSWDKDSPRYAETRIIPWADFAKRMGLALATVPTVARAGQETLTILERNRSGRVREALAANHRFSGVEVRKRLDLRSTNFTWRPVSGGVEVRTIGNGHGVGLCQYGANGLAKLGRAYREILSYYYPGTALQTLSELGGREAEQE